MQWEQVLLKVPGTNQFIIRRVHSYPSPVVDQITRMNEWPISSHWLKMEHLDAKDKYLRVK